jgi:hypothetical protein
VAKAGSTIERIFNRDRGVCWLCRKLTDREDATRDHVIPFSHGGPNNEPNLKLAHRKCNEKRANQILISKKESLKILVECQDDKCFRCVKDVIIDDVMFSRDRARGSDRIMMVAICKSGCDKQAYIPRQKNYDENKITKRLASRKNRIPMEMVVADSLSPDQVEIGDYVRFFAEGALHFGTVVDVLDNGDDFTVTLIDDNEGDKVEYVVETDTVVSLLVQEAVAV